MVRWWLGTIVGIAVGVTAGCLLELDEGVVCGDGFHDPDHEECDPGLPESFEHGCAQGVASCSTDTCRILCTVCGDNVLDDGEACDGPNFRAPPVLPCPGWTCANCEIVCPLCGNGTLDEGEQCELAAELSTGTTTCEQIRVPGHPNDFFVGGGEPTCRGDCTRDLSQCSLCGNDRLDDQIFDPSGSIISFAEECDGNEFDPAALEYTCRDACEGESGAQCEVTCSASCLDIEADDDPRCCIRPDFPRSESIPCCCDQLPPLRPDYCDGNMSAGDGSGGETSPSCPG